MELLLKDIGVAARVFTDMRKARAEGREVRPKMVMRMPIIKTGPSFYDTVEGCMFANRDKELRDAVWTVFRGLPYEDKEMLSFSPENGRFLVRAGLWNLELEPALTPRLYHKAMGAILHQYIRIKSAHVRGI